VRDGAAAATAARCSSIAKALTLMLCSPSTSAQVAFFMTYLWSLALYLYALSLHSKRYVRWLLNRLGSVGWRRRDWL